MQSPSSTGIPSPTSRTKPVSPAISTISTNLAGPTSPQSSTPHLQEETEDPPSVSNTRLVTCKETSNDCAQSIESLLLPKNMNDSNDKKYSKTKLTANEEAKASVLNSSCSDYEEETRSGMANGATNPTDKNNLMQPRNEQAEHSKSLSLEDLNKEAKIAVLQSTSSDNKMTQQLVELEEKSPKKRLKTKRELDNIRRQSGHSELDTTSSSDDDQ